MGQAHRGLHAHHPGARRVESHRAKALIDRGVARVAKGDYARAIADYNGSLRLNPKDALAYSGRARQCEAAEARRRLGAVGQFQSPGERWLAMVYSNRSRASKPRRFASRHCRCRCGNQERSKLAAAFSLCAAALTAADDANPHTKAGQLCEANFFRGERALQQGAKDEAAFLFRRALASCPKDFDERIAAGAELKALGAAP